MAEPLAFKYRAFISYAHADTRAVKRLHRRLESFRIDKDLIGRQTAQGPVPPTLRPIFRDRDDFTAGHSLTEQTLAAISASAALIVLCSPTSAKSHYVNEEIRLFRSRHPDRPVVPVIIDGTPGGAADECFPPALRFAVSADGTITETPEEPLAADVRESGDGFALAVAKVVARLIDLPTDDVFRRAERDRRRRARVRNGIIAALALLALAAVTSAAYARQQLMTNEAFLEATLKRATEIVNTAVLQAEKYSVPRAATLQLLSRAEGLFDDIARLGRPTAALQRQKAWMLIEFARNYEVLGDTTRQQARVEDAYRIMESLAAAHTEDATALRDLSVAENERGDLLVSRGDLPGALAAYRKGFAIAERLARAVPDNADWQRDLFLSHTKIGDVLAAQGDIAAALKYYREGLAIAERLAKAEPESAQRQRDLSIARVKVGDLLVAQGDLAGGLQSYRDSLAIRQHLAEAEPGNPNLQRDLAIAHERVGDVLSAMKRLADALTSYRASLAITVRLAAADAGNATWQRDLSVSYDKIGNMLALSGQLGEALATYKDGLAIAQRLAASDPGNTTWQRDLSVSHMKIGDVLGAQGNLSGALLAYADSLEIRERLVKADPDNADWQSDLATNYRKLARVCAVLGKKDQAAQLFRLGREIVAALAGKSSSKRWADALRGFDEEIAKLAN
jgi:tetratricopeptide (TPR) repeat protein